MFGFFKPKASEVIDTFQKQAFSAWGVQSADVATTLRFRAALAIFTSIQLSTLIPNRASVEKISNEIFSKIISTVANERCYLSDVFSISENVRCIDFSQSKFLAVANLPSANVTINGLGVLDNLAQAFGSDCAQFLQGRDGGNMLQAGMMLLRDLTIGHADNGDIIASIRLSQNYMEFFDKIMKAS